MNRETLEVAMSVHSKLKKRSETSAKALLCELEIAVSQGSSVHEIFDILFSYTPKLDGKTYIQSPVQVTESPDGTKVIDDMEQNHMFIGS